jgi:hypothetical protein
MAGSGPPGCTPKPHPQNRIALERPTHIERQHKQMHDAASPGRPSARSPRTEHEAPRPRSNPLGTPQTPQTPQKAQAQNQQPTGNRTLLNEAATLKVERLPFKVCPKCAGRLFIDVYRAREHSNPIWDVRCHNCAATVAQWLPGDDGPTLLYNLDGTRIPNPLGVPGYGEPETGGEEEAARQPEAGSRPRRRAGKRGPHFQHDSTLQRARRETAILDRLPQE